MQNTAVCVAVATVAVLVISSAAPEVFTFGAVVYISCQTLSLTSPPCGSFQSKV